MLCNSARIVLLGDLEHRKLKSERGVKRHVARDLNFAILGKSKKGGL